MTTQAEQILEDNLVKQLEDLGYSYVHIKNEKDLLANLKTQLETHNNTTLTPKEFDRVLNHLDKGTVFDRAGILRDKMQLTKDNGKSIYLEFLQQEHWCRNHFQVTRQVAMEGSFKNRYDVTLLVNGFPLVQIELKRRGLELKEAFNQTNRYQRHSYWSGTGLYQYLQLFVISNGVNTKYYANNRHQSFKQTFYWGDRENKAITQLEAFTNEFLEPCHLSKMICKYIVLHQSRKILMVLRSYQYHAVEALIQRIENSRENGYIWHATGSGKTLTSFKASQILTRNPKIDKVVFVVDRKDLDYQTQKEFDAYCKGSVDATENTRMLVKQFGDNSKPLILTTIQKLNNTIENYRYLEKMKPHKDREIIFIFDECHRGQFGETHQAIKRYFTNARMFGFTGTPIFAENAMKNALGKRTTKDLFDRCLHKYIITDAIRDENVLKFSIEYIGKYKEKPGGKTGIDIEVEAIDTRELLDSSARLEKITTYIIANHNRKTHSRDFTAMFCVSSVDTLLKYYQLFKDHEKKGAHNLKIAAIFSYTANEDNKDADGFEEYGWTAEPGRALKIAAPTVTYGTDPEAAENILPLRPGAANPHSRDRLETIIGDYNRMFDTKYSTKDSGGFYNYYQDIGKRVKNRRIDILLVVNMFLTGFDSPGLNTLYVDINLQYHGLIQAYSRTNRIVNEKKSHGNIVCFRNLKKAADDALTLFANKNAQEIVIMAPYEDYTQKFNQAAAALQRLTPTVTSVDDLGDENQKLEFIKAFRDLMRLENQLSTFVDFTWEHLDMEEQAFEDYKSKYLDLYETVKNGDKIEKVSILEDVDFELELLHRDEINVQYILELLGKLVDTPDPEPLKKQVAQLLAGQYSLRSKRKLIEKFIEENLIHIEDSEELPARFHRYWTLEKTKAFDAICRDENLSPEKCRAIIGNYLYTSREPLRDDVLDLLLGKKPGVLDRKLLAQRIITKLKDFVDTFIDGMDI